MIVSVWVAGWCLDEDRRVLRVGESFSSWLTFVESERVPVAVRGRLQTVRGVVRPLPPWRGALSAHPAAIEVGTASLYWDAPAPVEGAIEVRGSIESTHVDAPDGFPDTHGVVRRVRMEWAERVVAHVDPAPVAPARYEEVAASCLPDWDTPGPARLGAAAARWTGCLVDLEVADA